MEIVTILSISIPLCVFLFGYFRVVKKDSEVRRDKVVNQLERCVKETAATKESIKRVHQRIDTIEDRQVRLESVVEKSMDKLDLKLDKIMDFLLDMKGN